MPSTLVGSMGMPPLLVNALYGSRQVLAAAKVLSLPWDLVLKPHELDELAHLPLGWSTRMRRRLGQFKFKRHTGTGEVLSLRVELNFNLLRGSREGVVKTLAHEAAHALWPADAHGPRWIAACVALGGTGERCGELEVKHTKKVVARCVWCQRPFFGYRRVRAARQCKDRAQCAANQREARA